MDWPDLAVCRGMDHRLFFPKRGQSYGDEARNACKRCPVRSACLADALRHERGLAAAWRVGLWGGLTPEERYSLTGRRKAAA